MTAKAKKRKNFSKTDRKETKNILRGKFNGNMNGYGFVAREDGIQPDVFIPATKTANAITGDIVEFLLLPGNPRGPSGIVTAILKRTVKEVTGILLSERFLQPLDNRFPVKIKLKGSLKGAKKGDWLKARLLPADTDIKDAGKKSRNKRKSDSGNFSPVLAGEVISRIGKCGDILSDLTAVASEYGICEPYSEAENKAALRIRPRDVADRKDMTKAYTLTN